MQCCAASAGRFLAHLIALAHLRPARRPGYRALLVSLSSADDPHGVDRRIMPPSTAPAWMQHLTLQQRAFLRGTWAGPSAGSYMVTKTHVMLPLHAQARAPLPHCLALARAPLRGHLGCPSMPHAQWESPGLPRVRSHHIESWSLHSIHGPIQALCSGLLLGNGMRSVS